MHYSIYLPGFSGANPAHLNTVGLGDLLRDNDSSPQFCEVLDKGPDGKHGLYLTWKGSELLYRPGELTWFPAKPDQANGLEAGRFWWGIDPDRPPKADDLIRDQTIKGRLVIAAGNAWLIPNLLLLPHDFDLDDNGEETRVPQQAYASIASRCQWAYDNIKTQVETGLQADPKGMRRYCLEMLTHNYRLFRDLAGWLRILNDDNWLQIAGQTVDFEALVSLEEELLKKRQLARKAASTQRF